MNAVAEIKTYAGRVKEFRRDDWIVYVLWIGLMCGLFFSVAGFVAVGHFSGVAFPTYVYVIPAGIAVFVGAIAFDTIGHRTIYKPYLAQVESLVHGITIFAGITSVLGLCLGYQHPEVVRYPVLVLILLSILYSLIDEALHWRRYLLQQSDRVEMWSHFFILLGHGVFIWAWWHWYDSGYPGVAQTLQAFQ